MKLLAVGDVHLGRRPSRLPESLQQRASELSPAGAWRQIVAAALDEHVDVVLLAGDVVEREQDFFEAYRELRQGIERLTERRVGVYGVAGNHDGQVLPRLADEIPGFRLIGRGGHWESVPLAAGGENATLWGWSFPRAGVRESPLARQQFQRQPGGPNVGLLHCDRDQTGSPYAPVSSAELEAAALDGWFLGHVHKPDALSAASPYGYLGCVSGMDPGESGARGPWLMTVDSGRIQSMEQWTLAPLRWEHLDVDLTGIDEPADARSRLLGALRNLDSVLSNDAWIAKAVGLRMRFIGRTPFGGAAVDLISDEDRSHIHSGERDTHYFIERLEAATQPEIPLQALAERADPAGLLARRLLMLDLPAENAERRALLDDARRRLKAQAEDPRWSALGKQSLDEAVVADWLRRAGTRLLDRLMAQHPAE